MSYILEALKKSEKENQRENIPDLQTDHSLPPVKRQKRKSPLPYILGVVALLLGITSVLLWRQFGADQSPLPMEGAQVVPAPVPAVQQPELVAAPKPAISRQPVVVPAETHIQVKEEEPSVVVAARLVEPEVTEPTVAEAGTGETGMEESASAVSPGASTQEAALLPLLEELAPNVKAAIPELSFAGHVYADEPQGRLIIINSRIVREGDLIGDGLSLREINANGVVLQYETTLFRVQLF